MQNAERANDIMIPLKDYPYINTNCTLLDAMEVFDRTHLQINGKTSLPRVLLVFNENDDLMGIVRRRDILRGLEPDFLSSKSMGYRKMLFDVRIDPNLTELNYDHLIEEIKTKTQRTVDEILKPVKGTVTHEDHLGKIVYEMVENNVALIPVLDGETVVGVVRSVDVFDRIYHLLNE